MKSATSLFLSIFALVVILAGCSDSTGQDYDQEIAQDRTEKRSQRGGDDDWSEHRENFGDRRTTSSRSADDKDWGSDDNDSDWNSSDYDNEIDELKRELDGLVDLDELERKLKSIEREFESEGNAEGLEELENAFESLGEAFSEVGNAISNGIEVKSVDYDELKGVLPNRIRGYEKKNFNGDKVSVFGFNLSVLEQEYESDRGNGALNITVIDLGSLANAALVGLDWLDLEIKSESSTGFEQTTTIDGYPAFEQCDNSGRKDNCSLHLVVEERFVVQIESDEMEMNDIKDVLDKMDIKKLAEMSEEGI